MAAHQDTTDFREEEIQPNSTEPAEQCDEYKPTEFAVNEKQRHSEDFASSPESVNREAKGDTNEDVEQADENGKSAENDMVPPIEASFPEKDGTLEENSSLSPDDSESHGDYNEESPQNEEQAVKAESVSAQEHIKDKKAQETTASSSVGDMKDDQVDGPDPELNESPAPNSEVEEDAEDALCPTEENDTQEALLQTPQLENMSSEEVPDKQRRKVETIGPTTQGNTTSTDSVVSGGGFRRWMLVCLVVACAAILIQHLLKPESPPKKNNIRQIDIFLKQMDKVKTQFPHQRAELWIRSKIHLQRHIQTAQPTEPVSLILTAGLRAERTLHCLAQGLASAFSSAFNASVLHIDGASKANQDSDQVKLDIDSKLQAAFEGDKPVAVIHRFEELPPGSTLIFYRYCDHENAAYKKTFLIFTVLLGEEADIPAKIHLNSVEEMVDDHLQKKFLSHGHPVSFDRMDLDKYGGLWSRISHLILPVAAEERIEHEGC